MKKCEECGKKLGVFAGYIHPTMGKKYLLCSRCYNQVSESVEVWRKFVLTYSFNNKPLKNNTMINLKKIKPSFKKILHISKNIH